MNQALQGDPQLTEYIVDLVNKQGPDGSDYEDLDEWFLTVANLVKEEKLPKPSTDDIVNLFGPAMSKHTMQGWVVNTPHGYHGDFRIIDKTYTHWVSDDVSLEKWDRYYHAHSATKAVRNRKLYFKKLLGELDGRLDTTDQLSSTVLNIGSGPCRDVKEFFDENPESRLYIHSVDMDESAMRHAEWLLADQVDRVKLIKKNAFRLAREERYELVWSAGLFDYLDDKQFVHLLKKLFSFVDDGGELIVGNFSDKNPSQDYMEFAGWILNHRSRDELFELVERSGVDSSGCEIDQEGEGVNLFLRLRK